MFSIVKTFKTLVDRMNAVKYPKDATVFFVSTHQLYAVKQIVPKYARMQLEPARNDLCDYYLQIGSKCYMLKWHNPHA